MWIGTIYVSTGNGLTVVNEDGTIRWTAAGTGSQASPVIDTTGNLYIPCFDRALHAVHPSGTNLWQVNTDGYHTGAAALSAHGFVYAADFASNLVAVASNGVLAWSRQLGASSRSSPAIAPDGTIYVGTDGGRILSFFGSGALADTAWPMFARDGRHTARATNVLLVPSPPVSVLASDGEFNDRIRVTWESVAGAYYYEVWRSPSTNLEALELLAPRVTVAHVFDDRSVPEAVEYSYFVRAGNAAGLSPYSVPAAGFRRIAAPGEIIGEFFTSAAVASAVAVASNGLLCFSGSDARLYALTPNLTEQWRFELGTSGSFSTPAISPDGRIYVAASDQTFRALGIDGVLLWKTNNVGATVDSPAALGADGTIYFGSRQQKLFAFDPDGTMRWGCAVGGAVNTAPVVGVDESIYFGCADRRFYAVTTQGSVRWSLLAGGALRSHPAIGPDGVIYFGCDDRRLYAVTPEGQVRWTFLATDLVRAAPVVGPDGTIYVGANSGLMYALRPDGAKRWQFQADGSVLGAAAVAADGSILFGASSGHAYALTVEGNLLWRTPTQARPRYASLLLPDQRWLVGGDLGPLTCFRTEQSPAGQFWSTGHQGAQRTGCAPVLLRALGTNPAPPFYAGEVVEIIPQLLLSGRQVVRSELLLGTNLVAASTNSPFTLSWENHEIGPQPLWLRAQDDAGIVYRSGPIPMVAVPLRLRLIPPEAGQAALAAPRLEGHQLTLETSTNLSDWMPLTNQPVETESELRWTLERPTTTSEQRFYRVNATR